MYQSLEEKFELIQKLEKEIDKDISDIISNFYEKLNYIHKLDKEFYFILENNTYNIKLRKNTMKNLSILDINLYKNGNTLDVLLEYNILSKELFNVYNNDGSIVVRYIFYLIKDLLNDRIS